VAFPDCPTLPGARFLRRRAGYLTQENTMKKSLTLIASALALGGMALAEPINTDTKICMSDVHTAVETNTSYDAFIPTQFLDTARVIEWKSPYSADNVTPIATLVVVEGVARKREDHDNLDDVTVKCGMDMGVVKAIEIIEGHNVKIVSPITATEGN
jgi:hypothetical protein